MAEEQKTEELSEEAKLAQEALDATPETPAEEPVKEDMVPATVVATQRAARRAAELEAARLQGENAALKAAQVKQEKSPMEKAAKEQECSIDEVQVTGKLYREQQAFEKTHATAQSEQETYARQEREYNIGLASIPTAERDELIATGGHLLTDGDKRNIWDAGKDSGKELKRILTFRIEQAGLQPTPKSAKAEKTEKTDKSKAEEKAAAEAKAKENKEVPSQEEILKDEALDKEYKKLSFVQ